MELADPFANQHPPIPYIADAGLFTDFYELTMVQGFFAQGIHETTTTFDYFFRKTPFGNGFVVFAGLQDLLDTLSELRFSAEAIDFLAAKGFQEEFLAYLTEFRFRGALASVFEGDVVFPGEPIVRLTGPLADIQLVETLVLNLLNFQSLVATKAARMRLAAGPEKTLIDFGLRRAQGLGGIHASRAAMIGGFNGTSNVHAGKTYGIPVMGTMAHSWVQSFDQELDAFRAYAALYPDSSVLLVDTYSTLESGVPNAITVAGEMAERGQLLRGIRLDSGDLAYFAGRARRMLDEAGLTDVKIHVSNQLDEVVIRSLMSQSAPIDGFGVGTRLVTADGDPALGGVYKQSMIGDRHTIKVSENPEKVTLPGVKKVWRTLDSDGFFAGDAIGLAGQGEPERFHHPVFPVKNTPLRGLRAMELLVDVMHGGEPLVEERDLGAIAAYSRSRLDCLPPEVLRFENPHEYKVGISPELMGLRDGLLEERLRG